MGFLSKLFGGDSEPPSRPSEREPSSQAVATQVSPPTLGEPKGERPVQVAVAAAAPSPKAATLEERRLADDEPTADLSNLAAKRRGVNKPKPKAAAQVPPASPAATPPRRNHSAEKSPGPRIAAQRPIREEETRRDVAAVGGKPAPPQRAKGPRRRSPGFYSVSNFPAVDMVGPEAAKSPKIEILPAAQLSMESTAAPPVDLSVEEVAGEREETNPGLGHARSRHDPKAAQPLPELPARFLAEFASELVLEQDVESWLKPVSAEVETLISAARESNRDELLGQLRQVHALLQAQDTTWSERSGAVRDALLQLQTAAPWPFHVDDTSQTRSGLVVEQVLAAVAGVDASALEKIHRHKLLSLRFWQTLEPEQVRKHYPAQPDWFEEARSAFEVYTERRRGGRLASVKLGCWGAVLQLLQELREADRQFQNACDEDSSAGRRATRRHRQVKSAEALVLLAEFGEVDILRKIEHSSVQGKIECLDQWLQDAKRV